MAKSKSTVKKAPARKAEPKVAQQNPFCSDLHGGEFDVDLTISNVMQGLCFLEEADMPTEVSLSSEAECGRQAFIRTLRAALVYVQTKRNNIDAAARAARLKPEVTHG